MKKVKLTSIAVALLFGGAFSLSAESHMDQMMSGKKMQTAKSEECQPCRMHGKGMMAGNRGMMAREAIASEDGGVIIVAGPFLLKYDAELNLVKKVEIDLGPEDMKKMMARKKKMQEMMMESSKDTSE